MSHLLEAAFHHLVLPPKLPRSFDGDDVDLVRTLGDRIQNAVDAVRGIEDTRVKNALTSSLQATRTLNERSLYQQDMLLELRLLGASSDSTWLGIHVTSQNAALIIHRDFLNDIVIFEAFQAAAPVSDVLGASHALTWDFPSRAVAIPLSTFNNDSFLNNLSRFLEQATSTAFDRFAARASKAGQKTVETRDCPSPALIVGMLMSFLEGLGGPVQINRLRKRVRDDVVLDASEVPWRRSPYWLVLRVTIGRLLQTLCDQDTDGVGLVYYKVIMCLVLAQLLRDSVGKIHPEMALMLQAKLCRRLAKLASEKSAASGSLQKAYATLLEANNDTFLEAINYAKQQVASQWHDYKAGIIRQIPILPHRLPKNLLSLDLLNSRPRLFSLLTQSVNPRQRNQSTGLRPFHEGTIFQISQLAAQHISLIDYQGEVASKSNKLRRTPEQNCTELSNIIISFIDRVGNAYLDTTLPMSRYLLKLFELWVAMDKAATEVCPLLLQFHPVFVARSLDVLCLTTVQEMERLKEVQRYIEERVASHESEGRTIFSNPRKENSFPMKFVFFTKEGKPLSDLAREIDTASNRARAQKSSDLTKLTNQYDKLSEEANALPCLCTRMPDGSWNVSGCKSCWKKRTRKRLKIQLHEDFLPVSKSGTAHRAAILLELRMPGYLASYRAATWRLYLLGSQVDSKDGGAPALLLKDFDQLKTFSKPQGPFTLASGKKSFLQTHYNMLKLPKSAGEILRSFGPEFTYFDIASGLWADQLPKVPWFQHLLSSWITTGIPDPYGSADQSSSDKPYPPSSYEIMANESKCPPNVSLHEYSAFQRVVSGRASRWLVLLIELGATNVNFSSEATMLLFNHLALQAGPSAKDPGVLREAHAVFDDEAFCAKLCDQLSGRLDSLRSSWREAHYMSIIVTFSLRLFHLCPREFRPKAEGLLSRIRSITSGWITHLRKEIRSTSEGEVARKASSFAFWAALLCRQTFSAYAHVDCPISGDDIQSFFQASIALQESLLVNIDQLPRAVRLLLDEDLSNSYKMRNQIMEWFQTHQRVLENSINETWTDSGGLGRRAYSPWRMLSHPDNWWATSQTIGTQWAASQQVHYHLLQGHLLVDGKPLGRLPLQMRQDPAVQELFQGQHLLTCPSSLLEYQLVSPVEGHQVHFGFREGRIIIRAVFKGSLLEYVPRGIFKNDTSCDLPAMLVEESVHWLNLVTGQLEMRRKPRIWSPKPSNWVLDVRQGTAFRNKGRSRFGAPSTGSGLVEPRSNVGLKIASIFKDFEDADKLTIYQSPGGILSVEMKRLEIRFTVNRKGLLECRQLGAEVDPNQDAGTLYGLSGQIVMRSLANPDQKSILVPLGNISWERRGIHVAVKVANEGHYARYSVNQLLGRLECAPEPALLYLKAALHALTSFPLPDSLTLRTGTEEARHCLLSARSQPWSPLQGFPHQFLSTIKSASPTRCYYPPGIDLYQRVKWDDDLTMSIQHEDLALLVDSILSQSQRLEVFDKRKVEPSGPQTLAGTSSHLCFRGRIRRQIYERACCATDVELLRHSAQSAFYDTDQTHWMSKESYQVYQTTRALRESVDGIGKLPRLIPLLEGWPVIGGIDSAVLEVDLEALVDVEIPASWGSFVQTCRQTDPSRSYDQYFLLALIAFGKKTNMKVVQWLVAVSRSAALKEIEAPRQASFLDFSATEQPSQDTMMSLVLAKQPQYNTAGGPKWNKKSMKGSRITLEQYQIKQREEATAVASVLLEQWPDVPHSVHEFEVMVRDLALQHTNLRLAWDSLEPEVHRLTHNRDLATYVLRVEAAALDLRASQWSVKTGSRNDIWKLKPTVLVDPALPRTQSKYRAPHLTGGLMSKGYSATPVDDLEPEKVAEQSPSVVPKRLALRDEKLPGPHSDVPDHLLVLGGIIKRFISSSKDTIRQQYGQDLQMSLTALVHDRSTSHRIRGAAIDNDIKKEIAVAQRNLRQRELRIRNSLSQAENGFEWLDAGGLWPCLSPVALLEQLRDVNSLQLGDGMKEALVNYGVLITRLQRLLRMNNALLRRDDRSLREDQEQTGHKNWKPFEHPEWLLLEIDNNLLIRESQVDVARAIISPSSGSNSVLQMNMGQGKTSCIMPMAIVMLADRSRLCRVIVPRPLLLQTAQVMQDRIGGLIDRRVHHVPFSRRSPAQTETLDLFRRIHEDTLNSGGVMLCLPEHILSFKLSGLQQLADGQLKQAKKMIVIQRWLEASCRDVLDESDFTLSVKTQLIYPSGVPTNIDGHPHRWLVVEELLFLVEGHIPYLQSRFRGGVEAVRKHQGYPIIHILRTEVEDHLNALLVQDVCEGRLPQIQLKHGADREIVTYIGLIICGVDVGEATWRRAAEALTDDIFGFKCLCLLRGLISQRLLLLCIKKRWNVQYGLHPQRPPIAVPFEAKGVPSPTAEYGHPDTALTLTCLAFYQTGLTKRQIVQTLQHVLQSDDPTAQYEVLIQEANVPAHLQHWNLINADDELQVEELWQYVRLDRNMINYFLNKFAFPAHAKQFRVKLQASGWDIPLLPHSSPSPSLTTGFSGTNDNKGMLPLNIKQDDLESLVQTNAEVLSYLLEPRNQTCYQAVDTNGTHLTETGLLGLLRDMGIRILIDAGAHILEMENHDLAKAWLDINIEAQGAVYFGHDSRIMVRARFQKNPMPLLASPFAENLEECVIYIDEAHTRGTDLKLPPNARGAVTLALGQTKDKTVQAAMRLRQLGTTQSVAFILPPEVHRSVLDLQHNSGGEYRTNQQVTSSDVVYWLLEQSCQANESMMSLHKAQGHDFLRRTNALWKHTNILDSKQERIKLLESILQHEMDTLEQLYSPWQTAKDQETTPQLGFASLQSFASRLHEKLGDLSLGTSPAFEEVEQEREVEFEIEQIRENQKPVKYNPLSFPGLDPSIANFVQTGDMVEGKSFVQAFAFVGRTRIGQKFGIHRTASRLFVSREFTRTIEGFDMLKHNDIVRPVQWILWSEKAKAAIVVVPEEAELLMPMLREPSSAGVRLLTYSAPVTKSMRLFNTLTYFTIPSLEEEQAFPLWLSIEIGILAGGLYFDYSEYKHLLTWLGVGQGSSGSAHAPAAKSAEATGLLVEEPLRFLTEWLGFRRHTVDIMQTPMGYVCQRRSLREDHAFFASNSASVRNHASNAPRNKIAPSGKDGDEGSDNDTDWEELDA
ncbi:hypothetical protein B0I35DRAFT_354831 [Stachybotrys elegans]|uniref:ubiquitinyl hydrolase 1 n=1 Tax=Stachybotrys elegans TaxID=80388 RepID=A0A8K0WRV1_9HYPO|nr:hypothetical protein B0I35DRAFT_354831 [Stachybotrys elegans]